MSIIHSLATQPDQSLLQEPYRFNRIAVDSVNLIAGHGIEGDRKAGRNPKRQLNILSLDTVKHLHDLGYQTNPGELGEQIVLSAIDVMALPRGTLLQIGAEAIVEITFPRTTCSWLEKVQGKALEEGIGDKLGVLAMVIQGGIIRVGDPVVVLEYTGFLNVIW